MKEIKEMWLVYSLWECDPYEVDAIVINGVVIGYIDGDNELKETEGDEELFETEEDARAYMDHKSAELKLQRKEINSKLLERYMAEKTCVAYEEPLTLDDFIPISVKDKYIKQGRNDMMDYLKTLLQVVDNGSFTLDEKTIMIADVSHIEWAGSEEAIIVMKSGLHIRIEGEEEYKILGLVFNHERFRVLDEKR